MPRSGIKDTAGTIDLASAVERGVRVVAGTNVTLVPSPLNQDVTIDAAGGTLPSPVAHAILAANASPAWVARTGGADGRILAFDISANPRPAWSDFLQSSGIEIEYSQGGGGTPSFTFRATIDAALLKFNAFDQITLADISGDQVLGRKAGGLGVVSARTFPLNPAEGSLIKEAGGDWDYLPPNVTTTRMFLEQHGAAGVPFDADWSVLLAADIPGLDAGKIISGTFPTARIDDDAVTFVKLLNATAASRLIGSSSAWIAGDPFQEITLGTNISITGTTLNVTGGGGDHDHTAPGDGGVLTNDVHDGFIDISEISQPANPSTDRGRLYVRADGGYIELVFLTSQGEECVLCRKLDFLHANTLLFNGIEP